jgi:hypothetical protein
MASSLRPPSKIQYPVVQAKSSLHEMTESQNNSRATGLPLPSSNTLKHKSIDRNNSPKIHYNYHDPDQCLVIEPPSKQRKVGATQTGMQRPNSALGINRMAASTSGMRPPSRTMHTASQSVSTRGPMAMSSRPATSIHTGRPLSTHRPQGPKGHSRSKSQHSGLRPPTNKSLQSEDVDGKEPTGENSISVSNINFQAPLPKPRGTRIVIASLVEDQEPLDILPSPRSVSDSLSRPASLLSRSSTQSSLSAAMSRLHLKEPFTSYQPSISLSSLPQNNPAGTNVSPQKSCTPGKVLHLKPSKVSLYSPRKSPVSFAKASLKP